MPFTYDVDGAGATPTRGRYITRLFRSPTEAALCAADLHEGRRVLVDPSLDQCADIVGWNVTGQMVWWAVRREAQRAAIVSGNMPLVPPIVPFIRAIAPDCVLPTDILIDRLIAQYGVENVWRGLDRATTPAIAAE
jgi:hypothetical protein